MGFDPEKSKQYYGIWQWGQVAIAIYLFRYHNKDLDDEDIRTYEYLFRWASYSLLAFYLPASLSWLLVATRNTQEGSLTPFYTYYLLSFFSYGGPLITWFGIEILYLIAYNQGNVSGLYVANRGNYFIRLANMITYQLISLMAIIMALPGIKTWYDRIVIVRAELDESRQFEEEVEVPFCERPENADDVACTEFDDVEARL